MPRIIKDGLIYSEGAYQNYSTTEQVVGTWFDGSILYEKSYVANWATTRTSIPTGVTNISNVTFVPEKTFKVLTDGNNVVNLGYYISIENHCQAYYRQSDNTIQLHECGASYVGSGYVTIRYTKSSS